MAGNRRTRGNHEGSIRERRPGVWEARLTVEGKTQYFYATTRADVNKKLTAAAVEFHRGNVPVSGRQTVKEYLGQWIQDVKPEIEPSSWRRYHDDVKHLVREIGSVQLSKLNAGHIQSLQTALLAAGLSGSTVRHIRTVFHRAMKDAVRLGLSNQNAVERVRAPRKSTQEMHILTEEQAQAFLEAAKSDRYYALWVLAVTSGAREGELLGASWSALDLEKGTFHIRLGLQENRDIPERYHLAEPKTERSKRTLTLTRTAVEALRAHRERQNNERERLCEFWDTAHDLVFPGPSGKLMYPDILSSTLSNRHRWTGRIRWESLHTKR